MNPLKVAVIGVGALGRHHARILSEMDGVDLVAVSDPRTEQARSVAETAGCDWTHDYRELFARIDAASIVVPTTLHAAIASDFLCRGIPVLVEKPLASNVADGRALVEAADEQGVALQVGHIERFNPAFRMVAERTGRPKYIRAERLSPYAFRSMDIGAVHDLMIHDIDLALALVNAPLLRVEAFGTCIVGGNEDCVQARLKFENGCIADLVANRVCPTVRRQLQVWSESGCINADLQTRQVTAFEPSKVLQSGVLPFELARQPGADIEALKRAIFERFITVTEVDGSDDDALTAELSSFVSAVRHGTPPVVDGQAGVAALRVAEQILECVRTHAWDGPNGQRVGPHAHAVHERRAAA
jgi:predicted dehydrogenase